MEASALVLAAGEGTRMRSKRPKVSHRVLGKPLVMWAVDAARAAGAGRIAVVVGYKRDVVRALLPKDVETVVQETPRGTADAVASARDAFAGQLGSLLVLSGDCPLVTAETLKALVSAREASNAAVAVLTMDVADPTGYGRIVRDAWGTVERIVEQKDCSPEQARITECNSGFYCFDAEFLFQALNDVGTNNAQGEFYLTDVVELARRAGRAVEALCAADARECLGVNTRVQLAEATRIMQERINRAHMLSGVTMVDPASTWVGPDVRIDRDVELLPQTVLLGSTTVGEDSVVGPFVRLEDVSVGRGCVVAASPARGASLAPGTSLEK